eukprot:11098134-Karenia_brevis.AAC.1
MQDMQKQMRALQQEIAAMKQSENSQDSEVEDMDVQRMGSRGRMSGTPVQLRRERGNSRSPRKPA